MASNFWESGHWKCLTTRARLKEAHEQDRKRGLSEDNIQQMNIHVLEYLSELGKDSQKLIRQRVVATAMTYFRRFYLVRDFCEYDPRSVGPACLYLACKTEEAQVGVKVLVQIMKKVSDRRSAWPMLNMTQLLNLEMALLEELDYNLVVFSPYRDLLVYLQDERLSGLAEFAWAALNDSYRTDICLLYPPYLIALAAINTAALAAKHSIKSWLAELNVDFSKLADATRELLFCYKIFNNSMSAEEFNHCIEIIGTQSCLLRVISM